MEPIQPALGFGIQAPRQISYRLTAVGEESVQLVRLNPLRCLFLSMAPLRQNGVGPNKTCADAILPKGHERQEKTGYKFDAGFVLQ
jgi:hypothetical protein